ncbi:MAG: SCP2 sterol-binding domain-containing protein [Promethearchaeota archaeon]
MVEQVERVENGGTSAAAGVAGLKGVAAIAYTFFWPYKIDGRLRASMKGVELTIVVDLIDFPPAAVVEIRDGDFSVVVVEDPARLPRKPDISISGKLQDLIRVMEGVGKALKVLLSRKVKIKGKRKALVLAKLFRATEFELPGGGSDG